MLGVIKTDLGHEPSYSIALLLCRLQSDPWSVRVLPGVAFGLRQGELKHVYPFEPMIVAIGHEDETGVGRGSGSERDAGLSLSFFAERVRLWLWPSSARCVHAC